SSKSSSSDPKSRSSKSLRVSSIPSVSLTMPSTIIGVAAVRLVVIRSYLGDAGFVAFFVEALLVAFAFFLVAAFLAVLFFALFLAAFLVVFLVAFFVAFFVLFLAAAFLVAFFAVFFVAFLVVFLVVFFVFLLFLAISTPTVGY